MLYKILHRFYIEEIILTCLYDESSLLILSCLERKKVYQQEVWGAGFAWKKTSL